MLLVPDRQVIHLFQDFTANVPSNIPKTSHPFYQKGILGGDIKPLIGHLEICTLKAKDISNMFIVEPCSSE